MIGHVRTASERTSKGTSRSVDARRRIVPGHLPRRLCLSTRRSLSRRFQIDVSIVDINWIPSISRTRLSCEIQVRIFYFVLLRLVSDKWPCVRSCDDTIRVAVLNTGVLRGIVFVLCDRLLAIRAYSSIATCRLVSDQPTSRFRDSTSHQ